MNVLTVNTVSAIIKKYRLNCLLTGGVLSLGLIVTPPLHAATQHVIEAGETLSDIAARYDVSQTALIDMNGLLATHIKIGQILAIPNKNYRHNVYQVKSGDTLDSVAQTYNMDVTVLARANGLSPQAGLLIDSTLVIPVDNQSITRADINIGNRTDTTAANATLVRVPGVLRLDETKNTTVATTLAPATTATTATTATMATATTTAATPTNQRHLIRYGDNFITIAKQYQVKAQDLALANNMALGDTLYFGQYLTIPSATIESTQNNTSKEEAARKALTSNQYVVQSGDTLTGIAEKFKVSFIDIATLNGMEYYEKLMAGQIILLPKNAKAANNQSY